MVNSATASDAAPSSDALAVTQSLFLRGVGLVYLIAFLSLEWQVEGLFGADGLRPIADYLARVREALGGADLLQVPTVFWLSSADTVLRASCWVGAAAALLVVRGTLPLLGLATCWLLYLSWVSVGSPFLTYQWDALLLETGFLSLFWAPRTTRIASPTAAAPSRCVRFLLWWLVFRLMFFSGWVKLASGDPTWWNLTALSYHYETQPLPTWTSWYAHQLPDWFQSLSALGVFAIELVVPFFLVLGRRARAVAAVAFAALQAFIAATGNYGFFNLLSVVLCIPLLEDEQLLSVIPARLRSRLQRSRRPAGRARALRDGVVAAVLLAITVPASITQLTGSRSFQDLVSPLAQELRALHLTSRYGLFAVMTTTRPEVVLEGSEDGITWTPYRFRWKPGPLDRRPVFVEPDMPRLDWQMWFDALRIERALRAGAPARGVVTPSVLAKLREGSPSVLGLLGPSPFDEPPKHVRWRLYDYSFAEPSSSDWWQREMLYTP